MKYGLIPCFFMIIATCTETIFCTNTQPKYAHQSKNDIAGWHADFAQRSRNYKEQYPDQPTIPEKRIVVEIASYNNADWYLYNLTSVLQQEYSNYSVIYTDDCSTDDTKQLVTQFIHDNNIQDRVTLLCNETRHGQLSNHYYAIHGCNDDDIIVQLDADDWFAHKYVLQYINALYSNPDVWIAYGSYACWPYHMTGSKQEMPDDLTDNLAWRLAKPGPKHVRSFYAWLFKLIKLENLMFDGELYPDRCGKFFAMNTDAVTMLAMCEMAQHHARFIPDILYIYNRETPLNCAKIDPELIRYGAVIARLQKPYRPLTNPIKKQTQDSLKNRYAILPITTDMLSDTTQRIIEQILSINTTYILFTQPDHPPIEAEKVSIAINELEKTSAYAFYFSHTYTEIPAPMNRITDSVSAFCFAYAHDTSLHHNSFQNVLYRKRDLIRHCAQLSQTKPFMSEWQSIPANKNTIGLCFTHPDHSRK